MSVLDGLILILGAGAALLYGRWVYGRREAEVQGRTPLFLLRASALALIVFLLVDPRLPGTGTPPGRTWVLLDASASMAVGPDKASVPWARAVERAGELRSTGARVLLFGASVRGAPGDANALAAPVDAVTFLAPAVLRAAELGAGSLAVLTDRRIQDPSAVASALARVELPVRFESFEVDVHNAAVAVLQAPARVEAGDSVPVEVAVVAETVREGDSLTVEVRERRGRVLATQRLAVPGFGRLVRTSFTLAPVPQPGELRLEARAILEGDLFPDDDARSSYVRSGPAEGGIVLISTTPDWEPRFLLPVLERATGLPSRGFLALRNGDFLPVRTGGDRGPLPAPDGVAEVAQNADLLVVQGTGIGDPAFLEGAMTSVERALVLATGPERARQAGMAVGEVLEGEWTVSMPPRASPLAGTLAGASLEGLPPLWRLLPLRGEHRGAVPLSLRRTREGPEEAAIVLLGEGGRRKAVVLASGFWRWASRDGSPRAAYELLWSGVAGWLFENQPVLPASGVRPVPPVVSRGAEVVWVAGGLAGRRLRVEARDSVGLPRQDTVRVPEEERFRTAPLPPGHYAFRVRDESGMEVGQGWLEVEPFTEEILTLPVDLTSLEAGRSSTAESGGAAGGASPSDETARTPAAQGRRRSSGGRPLHTHPLPYLLLVGMLAVEWTLRWRRGLR